MSKIQPMKLITNTKGRFPTGKVRIGWYDPDLICQECEGKFASYDNYVPTLLLQNETNHKLIVIDNETRGWEILEFNYEKLKLFAISILWRTGASQLPQFRKIKFGVNLEKARQNILINNSGDENNFPFVVARFPDDIGQSFILDPHPETDTGIFAGLDIFRFYLGAGYILYINTGTKPFPHPTSLFVVSKNKPLRILARQNFTKSGEFRALKKVVNDASKRLYAIKFRGG